MKTEADIKQEAETTLALQRALESDEAELMQDERFRSFLTLQKETTAKIADTWKAIETAMIDNNIKSVKGDFGSITIAERMTFKVTGELDEKFYKKVPDTAKIGQVYKLEGEAPEGAEPVVTKYLMKRIK